MGLSEPLGLLKEPQGQPIILDSGPKPCRLVSR